MSKWDELKRLAEDVPDNYSVETKQYILFREAADPQEVLALIAENEALRKDAERYRWLRDKCHIFEHYKAITWKKDAMDNEIDECMRKEPRHD